MIWTYPSVPRKARALAALAFALLLAATSAVPLTGSASMALASTPTVRQLIGQKLMVAMSGTTPSSDLLGRISRGEVGGVILFGSNITGSAQLASLTRQLRAAAASGGQPPLLIATDQEGGSVKRVGWAPPTLSPPQMGALDSTSTAHTQGTSTGVVLGCAGINNDLAPVADVPASTSSFMYLQGRTWSFNAQVTANLSDAFASGLEAGLDVPVMKHFPGLGYATLNTDSNVVTVTASTSQLAPGLKPYQLAISHAIPMVMLSNATYTAYDSANAAGWSHAISVDLLRGSLGFTGVSITDSLTGTATARAVSPTTLAIKAAQAGTDMILLTGSESSTASTYTSLEQAATAGTIDNATLQASYTRILALKNALTPPAADTSAPSPHAPASRLSTGTRLGTSTVRVRTTYSTTDPCGISRYDVQRQVSGGTWYLQSLAHAWAPSITESLAFGTTYRYADRATDGAGNRSGWAYGATFKPLVSQEWSSAITYHGTWYTGVSSHLSGGYDRYSTAYGARATYAFHGASVAWVAYTGPNRGSAAVYLDGTLVATVSLYASTYTSRPIVYVANFGSNGSHTLRIANLGTAGHSRVDVDAFVRLYRT